MNLTLKEYINKVETGEVKPEEVVSHYLEKAKELNKKYNAFIRFHEDYVKENLSTFKDKPLKAAPIGIKDIILTQ
jgi:Asp-tRNA(Asn)/Glu-tRNA(Gln) amidotransferase A subunit family amidase